MNTIKVYLATSGRIAELKKDFPLYQGQFQNKLLNIYVPTSILAPNFVSTNADGLITADYVASTSVKIGMTYLSRDGSIKVSKNYYMRYLKTLTYQNVEYAMYERKLPKEFTLYAGQGVNAPTLVANVVNIQQDTESGTPQVLSIITSQTCSLDVMPSTQLDSDEPIEPSELDNISAQLNEIAQILPLKQDKTDERLETESKSVVGAINENRDKINVNIGRIEINTEELALLRNEIDRVSQSVTQQENYIGQMSGTSLPSNATLTQYVTGTAGRPPQNADVVIFVLYQNNTATRTYKYTYYGNGWNGYQLTVITRANNGVYGTIEGTYGIDRNYDTLIDVSGGEILNIYVKDKENNYRNIKEFLNTSSQRIDHIVDGQISAGVSLRAIADELGNDIVDTYLTKVAGATKQYVRDYAMPREFSSVYFISASGYVSQVPTTPADGIQFTTTTNNVGSYELFQISKENEAEYELTISNGYQNNIFVSADKPCNVQFRLTTQYRKVGEDWANLNVELSNPYSLNAGDIQKISFASPFTALGDNVVTLSNGDFIRQTLEVITQTSTELTFDVYSNDIYPSIFSLTSQSYVMRDVELSVGKTLALGLDGTIEGNNAIFVVQDANDFAEYKTNQRKFLCLMSLPVVGTLSDDLVVRIEFGDTVYNLYSYEKGSATPITIGDLASVMAYNSNVGYSFYPELYFIQNADIEGFVLVPSTITADQLINILGDDGSVLPMVNGKKINFSLSAELTNKIMRALLTPMSAPPATELVAIESDGSQTFIELGEGLELTNGTLNVVGGGGGGSGGTTVTVGGVAQETFNADTKVDVSTYNANKATTDQAISTLQGNVGTLQSGLSTAQQDIADNMGDISMLQGDMSTAQQNITLLQSDNADNKSDIADLQSADNQNVKLSGNQTIGGQKTFEDNIIINGAIYLA